MSSTKSIIFLGKSTLCNRIAGLPHDALLFPVSSAAVSCTQSTKFGNVFFGGNIVSDTYLHPRSVLILGNKERPISVIDTIGFDDPDKDTDVKIISELVEKLRTKVDHVNLFVIAVNGQNPRLDGSLVAMLKIFMVSEINQ